MDELPVMSLIKELNIDKSRIPGVSHKSTAWNVKMIATTELLYYSIYLFKSGCQRPEEKYDMGIPGFVCYWRLHHSHVHFNYYSYDSEVAVEETSNRCMHMVVSIPPPYRSRNICCGICWMFQRCPIFDIGLRSWVLLVGSESA